MCICVHTCICAYMYVHIHVYVCVQTCMYTHMYGVCVFSTPVLWPPTRTKIPHLHAAVFAYKYPCKSLGPRWYLTTYLNHIVNAIFYILIKEKCKWLSKWILNPIYQIPCHHYFRNDSFNCIFPTNFSPLT